jgi:hypothetical protein
MGTTRVLVTGCRSWNCPRLALACVGRMQARYGRGLVVVHGACPAGVDAAFSAACRELEADEEPHPADWGRYGKGAGPLRNGAMVAAGAAFCLAVHRSLAGSLGTQDCVRKALAAAIPVYLIDRVAAEPRRIRSVREADAARA